MYRSGGILNARVEKLANELKKYLKMLITLWVNYSYWQIFLRSMVIIKAHIRHKVT